MMNEEKIKATNEHIENPPLRDCGDVVVLIFVYLDPCIYLPRINNVLVCNINIESVILVSGCIYLSHIGQSQRK